MSEAGPGDLAFLDSPKYASQLSQSRAGACLTSKRFADAGPVYSALLTVDDPDCVVGAKIK